MPFRVPAGKVGVPHEGAGPTVRFLAMIKVRQAVYGLYVKYTWNEDSRRSYG